MAPGKIGIVTVLYNSEPVLEEFFASLAVQDYDNWTAYVIDNASRDAGVTMTRAQGARYRVIENSTNVGFAAGSNQGIRVALEDGCEYILLLNNDVVFGPDLLRKLVEGLTQYDCQITTPKMYYHNPPDLIWAAGGAFRSWRVHPTVHYGLYEKDRGQYSQPAQVTFSPACCLLIRGEVFARVGMMDEHYFVYYDDSDWMLRAMHAGLRTWYLPDAKLWHKVSSLIGRNSEFATNQIVKNHAYYNGKHMSRPAAFIRGVLHCSAYILQWLTDKGGGRVMARKKLAWWNEGTRMAKEHWAGNASRTAP